MATLARTAGALGLLSLTLPVDTALTGLALGVRTLRGTRTDRPSAPPTTAPPTTASPTAAARRRTVLLSGGKMTKALVLARAFHAAGHRVVLVESARYRLTGHRFSRAVEAFHVVPDAADPGYGEAILAVVEAEGVDVWVPVASPVASAHDADVKVLLRERLGERCEVVHLDPDDLERVDDKHRFAEAAVALGLAVPDTHRITEAQQVLDFDFSTATRPYILKSILYDPVQRLDLTRLPRPTREETERYVRSLPISPEQPFVLTEFVTGTEYCTHGTVREGRLSVFICCRSSAWQLTYEQVEHPGVRAWVERFVAEGELTGQLSFDLIEDDRGVVHGIECNPRTHSAITLLAGHPALAGAYLDDVEESVPVLEPPLGGRPTRWTYHELWQLLRHARDPVRRREHLRVLLGGTDAVFSVDDPWPFWMLHHVHVPSLLLANAVRLRPWLKIDLNIGKLVEPAGD